MLSTIQNEYLSLSVESKGAEIQSLQSKPDALEYIWQGDPACWAGRSPILFPVVAKQKDDCYQWKGKAYSMPLHGFAHSSEFAPGESGPDRVGYVLRSSEETRRLYPFDFSLEALFRLQGTSLQVTYTVINHTADTMPYSIGAHTGYRIPLEVGERYEDYSIVFRCLETAPRYPVKNKLLGDPVPYLEQRKEIQLTPCIFEDGALIFQSLRSREVFLRNPHTGRGVSVAFENFDYLGLWAVPGAPFVCIEPWNGLPSAVEDGPELLEKKGLRFLPPNERHQFSHTITILTRE